LTPASLSALFAGVLITGLVQITMLEVFFIRMSAEKALTRSSSFPDPTTKMCLTVSRQASEQAAASFPTSARMSGEKT
jgi:hypothetical protein